MTRKLRVVTATVLGAFLACAVLLSAGKLFASTLTSDPVPEIVNYQGYLTDSGGNPISGTVTLVFRIYDASSGGNELWNETHNNVPVSGGFFSVFLGGEGTPLTPSIFSGTSRYLEVSYGATTFARQRFASVPYALVSYQASKAISSTYSITSTRAISSAYAYTSGYAASSARAISSTYAMTAAYALNGPSSSSVAWENVLVVAKSGGDYTSINAAMSAISPTSSSRYLVLVMPGTYDEGQISLKPYVHLKGAGMETTYIVSQLTNADFNNDAAATLLVGPNTQISHLTVRNDAATSNAVALKILTGNEKTVLDHVGVKATGANGDRHIGLYIQGGNPQISHSYVEVSGATLSVGFNRGIQSTVSTALIHDTQVVVSGDTASGIHLNGGGPYIQDSVIKSTNGLDGKALTTNGNGNQVYIDHSTMQGDLGAQGHAIFSTDNYDFFVGASKLIGNVLVANANDITCAADYDELYTALNADCL